MTNNPSKLTALLDLGISVELRLPVLVEVNSYSAGYVKRRKMQHELASDWSRLFLRCSKAALEAKSLVRAIGWRVGTRGAKNLRVFKSVRRAVYGTLRQAQGLRVPFHYPLPIQ